ncbi:DNA-directed RNA polymerases I and III subunit RPAC2-like [Mercurialis annua]|uniref:DNA-directed RNA polymerases I and III subunit RPAC2-like n=1 Tax=Mercurialis annua TaxID=3986 RepID=UPI00215EF466|nr:DNA-directed RNA polymerases I and III subunit RPAC2-like [Mercurialis annua]
MEQGFKGDPSQATFSFVDEDHTLANSVRFTLNQDPRVSFCGYSIPHPSDARVNIRVQTTGESAREVLKDACQNLMFMCQQVRSTFDKAVDNHKANIPIDMDHKTNNSNEMETSSSSSE